MTDEITFKKTETQRQAIDAIVKSNASNFCLYGGSRSGKSFLLMRNIIIRASKTRSAHLIARQTFASAKTSIWMKTMPDVLRICFPDLEVKKNNTDYIATLPNGSTIRVAGLDDGDKVERLLGNEYSTIWVNEANQVPFPAVNKLKTRLAEKNSLRKMSYFDLNPTHKTSWVYQLFEQKVNPQDGEALSDPHNYASFRMNVHGNLENIDQEYIKLLESLPELEKKRFLYGEYSDDNMGAAVYAFRPVEHVSESAKKQPGTIFVGSDFNFQYNSDVLCSMTANQLYVWDEIQIEGDTYRKCDELILRGARGASIISDSTGKNRSTKGKSDHIILREAGFNVVQTLNPYVVDKIANLNRCFTMGLIMIHPRCKKLIRDLMQLQWDKHGELDQKTDPSLSHLVDALAYLCWKLFPMEKIENRVTVRKI